MQEGDRIKLKNGAQPLSECKRPTPVGWRVVAISQDGRAIVQVILIGYSAYSLDDLEYAGTG